MNDTRTFDEILCEARDIRAALDNDDPCAIGFDRMQSDFYSFQTAKLHRKAQYELRRIDLWIIQNRHRAPLQHA